MASKIINGTEYAAAIRAKLSDFINSRRPESTPPPHMAVVLVGENPASLVYIKNKRNDCEEIGIKFTLHCLPKTATQQEVLAAVHELNNNPDVNGILVQQPLPAHIDTHKIIMSIDPEKDVDCLHPNNLGLVAMGQAHLLPCTPSGIVSLLKQESIEISGKHAVIVGRSGVVGKPLAFMLLEENATVTVCHSKTQNLSEICRSADILVAAIGQPKFITADFVKEGAVVIDVGVNRQSKKLCGDVDFENIAPKASHITPVPGGVGPMTRATLMQNCVKAWEKQNV